MQLAGLLPPFFQLSLDQNSASKFIYNAFIALLFKKFTIPKEMQEQFDKWSRRMCTTCHEIPAPVSMVHLFLEFECPAPPGIVELLSTKGKGQRLAKCVSAPTATTPNSGSSRCLHSPHFFMNHFQLRCSDNNCSI